MTKFSIGDLFYILFLSLVISSLIYLWYIIANYEPSKTKIVSTLVCSGKVIVFDQDFLYMEKVFHGDSLMGVIHQVKGKCVQCKVER